MDRKRFGAGLVGGLLLALAVVGTSGYTSVLIPASSGQFAQNVPASQTQNGVTSTQATGSMTQTTTTGAEAATGLSQGGTTYTGVSSVTSYSVSSGTQSAKTESTSSQSPTSGPEAAGGTTSPTLAPSSLDSIAKQPALVDGLVVLPILVALVLGAILYRASRSDEETEADPGTV